MKDVKNEIGNLANKMTSPVKGSDYTNLSPEELEQKMNKLRNRFSSSIVTKIPASYAARLRGKATNPLTFELKALNRLVYVEYRQKGIEFDPQRFSPKIIRAMIAWFRGESEPLPQSKGVCLQGHTGCGKTVPFEVMQVVSKSDQNKAFGIVTADALSEKAATGDDLKQYRTIINRGLCIDDLGEEQKARYMGNEICAITRVINSRHTLWRKHGAVTHFTTNLEPDELREKYGDRVYRRLLEMCTIVEVR